MSKFIALTLIFQFVFVSKVLCDKRTLESLLPQVNLLTDKGLQIISIAGPGNSSANIALNPNNLSASGNISVPAIGLNGSASLNNLTSFAGNITVGNLSAAGGGDLKSLSLEGAIEIANWIATNAIINLKNGTLFNGNFTALELTAGRIITLNSSAIYTIGYGNEYFPFLRSQSITITKDGVTFNATGPIIDLINFFLFLFYFVLFK